MRYLLSLLFIFSTSLSANTLLVLGDSLSAAYGIPPEQGWVALLEQRLPAEDFQVINASVSGETTSGGLTRLPALLSRHEPDLLLLQLGANDALRGLPLQVIRSNLDALVEQARQAGTEVLLIGIRIPPNYGPQYTESFFNLYAEIADQYALPRVPFLLENVALDWNLMQSDGLHPNADAQPLILDNVWLHLEPLLFGSE
ncbi:Arylesterase precursor [Nitrincola lacisaponensis]|uniref:Arylesterase n=1 Tax=Nitrincola lacisaponensis TaxID=267850 RepID=A0A063Y5Z9_9GAMM|nr:arylesterase [Nitrincola lacisaponensis]KDE41084.1 Arylesterase precursor [Nitrincola lacisaponensis]